MEFTFNNIKNFKKDELEKIQQFNCDYELNDEAFFIGQYLEDEDMTDEQIKILKRMEETINKMLEVGSLKNKIINLVLDGKDTPQELKNLFAKYEVLLNEFPANSKQLDEDWKKIRC